MKNFESVQESNYDGLMAESAQQIRILDAIAQDNQLQEAQGKWGNQSTRILRWMVQLLSYLVFVLLGSFMGVLIMLIWRTVE